VKCIGNFLIRIKNDCFHTVCPYEKSNTLIRQCGISTPSPAGLLSAGLARVEMSRREKSLKARRETRRRRVGALVRLSCVAGFGIVQLCSLALWCCVP